MIVTGHRPAQPDADVIVVGSGPVGLAVAVELERLGRRVVVLESGLARPSASQQQLSDALMRDAHTHAPMALAVMRALGGSSRLWGGRCVPFDDYDFEDRPFVSGVRWPITHRDLAEHYVAAAQFLGCSGVGIIDERGIDDNARESDVLRSGFERWVDVTGTHRLHADVIAHSPRLQVFLGRTVIGLDLTGQRISGVAVRTTEGTPEKWDAPAVVLACGGLENARLLLQGREEHPYLRECLRGPLGEGYMGHISGRIATVEFSTPTDARTFDYVRDVSGGYVRRRMTLHPRVMREHELQNIAFSPEVPPIAQAEHGDGVLSLVWLALRSPLVGRVLLPEAIRRAHLGAPPHRMWPHLMNVARSLPGSVFAGASLFTNRYLRHPRKPGVFLVNRSGSYALHYHAEHSPDPASRVSLSNDIDALGVRRLSVDLRFAKRDAQSVVRAHSVLDDALRRASIGRLRYLHDKNTLETHVRTSASDGFHQIGTTRMGRTPAEGVVDSECRVFGVPNLFVAGSSVFASSGQANPTFAAVALAVRLGRYLARQCA